MRIDHFEVTGLLGRPGTISFDLQEDLNILTGRNGAGKTSLLKLLWYILSGNILIALQEVPFARAKILTTDYECIVHRVGPLTCRIEMTVNGTSMEFEDAVDDEGDLVRNAEDFAESFLTEAGSSVFFPTFRRIEGGFTLTRPRPLRRPVNALAGIGGTSIRNDVENALLGLSRRLTNGRHLFVSSISTVDIVTLLLDKFAELSQKYTAVQQETSSSIIETIKEFRLEGESEGQASKFQADKILDGIQRNIEQMESKRDEIMNPIDAVQTLVERLFKHQGISIGARLSFGNAAAAVNSDLLSAGEKQMLSFISYNTFNTNGVIFIDEPELSLHVDWQRQLFTVLSSQKSSNQYIIATHSPFIYSKYAEKEISMDIDKGDQEV